MVHCRYDEAELCAQRALVLDPQFVKARYRRGLARKGNFEFAKAAIGTWARRPRCRNMCLGRQG
jgi:hypothetical protein